MGCSIRLFGLGLALSVTLLIPSSAGAGHRYNPFTDTPQIKNHGGEMLTGKIKLAIMWYGDCGKEIKNTMRNFIKSLNFVGGSPKLKPKVASWWEMVESYQSLMPNAKPGKPPKISVKVARQSSDKNSKFGKVLTLQQHVPKLIQRVTKGDLSLLPVIVGARDITIQGVCYGRCSFCFHTEPPNPQTYIVVGNPEFECPEECIWPFHATTYAPKGPVLKPPNGNLAADAMVVSFASALVDSVTNPMRNATYHSFYSKKLGPCVVCSGIFGRGSTPGNPGLVQTDPKTGGNYNFCGYNNKKFLLPAIWNPITNSCWTG
ncbi:Tho complex subunit 7/Mft1p [Hibiscus syriacus]|uniref:Tho complex subunit 7/Mft1p n=1 Tax=Hibiscus syriacus TaxID=106335 RepID=A0A6A3BZF1_HIBSY|nr:protein EXORDIUM-like [Hibiscus syriacus]KAE8720319.1 Tho complex subunit 7/Mft1p [Hibiscus syriacus]